MHAHRLAPPLLALTTVLLAIGGCASPRMGASGACSPGDTRQVAQARSEQIFIELECVRIPVTEIDAALDGQERPGDGRAVPLTRAEAALLLTRWRSNERLTILSKPRILSLPGQEATMEIGETIPFGRAVEREGTLRLEERPPTTLWIGERLRLTATPDPEGDSLRIQLHHSAREHVREPRADEVAGMSKEAYRDAFTTVSRLQADFEMANDSDVLLGTGTILEDRLGRHIRLLLLHARTLTPDEARATVSGS